MKTKPPRKTLREGEYYNQKAKRYEYHYIDLNGKKRVISSSRLTAADQLPKGKKKVKSLREKEDEINKIVEKSLDINGKKITLIEVVEMYMNYLMSRKKLAYSTISGYNTALSTLKQYHMGHMPITEIKMEHCEAWLVDMRSKYRGSSVQRDISLIKRSFEYAVDHDWIAKNPFRHISTDRSDSKLLVAVPKDQMNSFLEFCRTDPHSSHCADMLYIMFWTGLRVSELCGLTLDNIDMDRRLIFVEKQLRCINHAHIVIPPKTVNGKRYIPMTDGVHNAFQRVIENRWLKGDIEPVCYDERGQKYSGFVFLATRSRKTIVRSHVEEYLQNCIKRYNKIHPDEPIDKFEPHVCRHTFATNMQHLSPKTLQSVLGHSSIKTTMDIYVDAMPTADQISEMNKIESLITENNKTQKVKYA